jgi:hypothetical protein
VSVTVELGKPVALKPGLGFAIEGIRAQYKSEPLPQAPPVMPIAYVK